MTSESNSDAAQVEHKDIAVIGCGYCGQNLIRILAELGEEQIREVVERIKGFINVAKSHTPLKARGE